MTKAELLAEIVELYDRDEVAELGGGCECCGTWVRHTPAFERAIEKARKLLKRGAA